MICPISAPFLKYSKRKIPRSLENKAFSEFSSAPPVVIVSSVHIVAITETSHFQQYLMGEKI